MNPFYAPVLNDFIALGKKTTQKVRNRIIELFSENNKELKFDKDTCSMDLFKAEMKICFVIQTSNIVLEHVTAMGTSDR